MTFPLSCPKQSLKIEGVVLHGVRFLEISTDNGLLEISRGSLRDFLS